MQKEIFQGYKFVPLLNTRDALIVLEILSFGLQYKEPEVIIYQNKNRTCDAFTFRKEILFQFTARTFSDICLLSKAHKDTQNLVTDEIARRLAVNFYNAQQLNQGMQWLDASIFLECTSLNSWDAKFLPNVVWTDVETMHWRLYLAKKLIQYA